MSETVNLDQEIRDFVSDSWLNKGRPILLSALGGELSDAAKFVIRGLNAPLRRYIADHLQDSIRVVSMPARGDAAVPLEEAKPFTDAQLTQMYLAKSKEERPPRYLPAVWRAFRVPIPEGHKRFLMNQPGRTTRLREMDVASDNPEYAIEVRRQDLAVSDIHGELPTPEAVEKALAEWRRINNVPLEYLTISKDDPHPAITGVEPAGHNSRPATIPKPSLKANSVRSFDALEAGLSILTKEELARISIPADILLSVLERIKTR